MFFRIHVRCYMNQHQKEVIGFEKIDRSTEEWLDSIAKKLQYTKWYFWALP